jgi:alcohol dehydrogenase
VNVTVDALGSVDTARSAIESLKRLGRHVQIGLLPPAVIGDHATIPMHRVIGHELTVMGSHGMSAATYPDMLADIAAGRLRPDLLIERVISLEEVPAELAAMSHASPPGVTIIHP